MPLCNIYMFNARFSFYWKIYAPIIKDSFIPERKTSAAEIETRKKIVPASRDVSKLSQIAWTQK
jgi:hypothetical protein